MEGRILSQAPAARESSEPGDRFLARVLDHLGSAAFVKDASLRLVVVNQPLCELLRRPAAALLGKQDRDIFPNTEAERFRAHDLEVLSTGRAVHVDEETVSDATGQAHIVTSSRVPLTDESGAVTHIVGTLHNITQLKELERALRDPRVESSPPEEQADLRSRQNQVLRKERLMVLGQLAAGLAHQIRNPLCAISNAVALIRKQLIPESTAIVNQALDIAQEEIWVADRILTDLLEYSRIQPPQRVNLAVSNLVDNILREESIPDNIAIDKRLGPHSIAVDERQVSEAVRKVIRNALEAMEQGGTLTIASRDDGDEIELSIADTGVGLTQATVQLLFEPLVTSKPLALGLGLTTARALVANQNGTLDCAGASEQGARFLFRLPKAVV